MTFIREDGYHPNDLHSDFYKSVPDKKDPSKGDVYFNYFYGEVADRIDYAKLPFRAGTIHYKEGESSTFKKGKYCGNHYKLQRQIFTINQNLMPDEKKWYTAGKNAFSKLRFTQEGCAVYPLPDGLHQADLNIEEIEDRYNQLSYFQKKDFTKLVYVIMTIAIIVFSFQLLRKEKTLYEKKY